MNLMASFENNNSFPKYPEKSIWLFLGGRMISLTLSSFNSQYLMRPECLENFKFSKLILGKAWEAFSYHLVESSFILLLD